jgi:hypothetical protein
MRLHPLVAILTVGAFFVAALAIASLVVPDHPFARDLLRATEILGLAALIAAVFTLRRNDGAKD